jgi:hypothetical protein
MIEPIKSEKTVEVAELLRLDLQFLAEDLGGGEGSEGNGAGTDDLSNEGGADDLGGEGGGQEGQSGNNQGVAGLENNQSFKGDPQNQAFAQMRRDKETAEAQLKAMDAMISEQYGDMGIHTFADYQQALEAKRKEDERQQYLDAGLPEEIIDKLSKVDEVLQQAEQEKFNRQLSDGYLELQKEYPDLVKKPEDIHPEVWQKWQDGKTGLSLTDAYELVNKKAIREHLQAASKQSTLNQVNSKSHLRGNGGEGADDVDLTSIPAETMATYRQMFAKELRTGKMKESDFVKHYKKSNS